MSRETVDFTRLCIYLALVIPQAIHAKSLWSTSPARASEIINTTYPIGNGRLAAMPSGPAGFETLTLNLDSLWSGGPFEVTVSYDLFRKPHTKR
jgi:alpha-L-fucosidase 2